MPTTRGYAIKIQDGQDREKKFFSKKAKAHLQGSSLAAQLITHLSLNFAQYGLFTTRSVEPSDGGVGFEDISRIPIANVQWP